MTRFCLAVMFAATAAMPAAALDSASSGRPAVSTTKPSPQRYFQLRRLNQRERGRPAVQHGSNCVTPKIVCWIAKPAAKGEACTCNTRRLGRVTGAIEG